MRCWKYCLRTFDLGCVGVISKMAPAASVSCLLTDSIVASVSMAVELETLVIKASRYV